MSSPTYSSGEKIIFTASAFVSQLRTPATTGIVSFCSASRAVASTAVANDVHDSEDGSSVGFESSPRCPLFFATGRALARSATRVAPRDDDDDDDDDDSSWRECARDVDVDVDAVAVEGGAARAIGARDATANAAAPRT
eukprot:30787-Pelagococcus_subviridis.AAC.6